MGYISSGDRAPKKVHYLFIDGAFLDNVIETFSKEYFDIGEVPIDYKKIARYRGQVVYDKVFYYHALPGIMNEEIMEDYELRIKPKEDFFNSLKLIDNFHVYEGVTFRRRGRTQQKTVDIKIAVDMLKHTINGNMQKATLIASDTDFKPLLDSLVSEGMETKLLYRREKASDELLYSADISKQINLRQILDWSEDEFRENQKFPPQSTSGRNLSGLTEIANFKIGDKLGFIYKNELGGYVAEYNIRGNISTSFSDSNYKWIKKFLKFQMDGVEINEIH